MSYRVEKYVMVPMRDGQTLATDLWIPDGGEATPRPVTGDGGTIEIVSRPGGESPLLHERPGRRSGRSHNTTRYRPEATAQAIRAQAIRV